MYSRAGEQRGGVSTRIDREVKAFMRAARPRSFDHVCALVATALGFYTATECANYVRHCGYRVATTL
jgi:hypothetical protein